jgi:hypothetical protein
MQTVDSKLCHTLSLSENESSSGYSSALALAAPRKPDNAMERHLGGFLTSESQVLEAWKYSKKGRQQHMLHTSRTPSSRVPSSPSKPTMPKRVINIPGKLATAGGVGSPISAAEAAATTHTAQPPQPPSPIDVTSSTSTPPQTDLAKKRAEIEMCPSVASTLQI